MIEFRCADAGTVCRGVVRAHSREELLRQMADHLSQEHRVKSPTRTIMNYLAGLVRTVEEPARARAETR